MPTMPTTQQLTLTRMPQLLSNTLLLGDVNLHTWKVCCRSRIQLHADVYFTLETACIKQ